MRARLSPEQTSEALLAQSGKAGKLLGFAQECIGKPRAL